VVGKPIASKFKIKNNGKEEEGKEEEEIVFETLREIGAFFLFFDGVRNARFANVVYRERVLSFLRDESSGELPVQTPFICCGYLPKRRSGRTLNKQEKPAFLIACHFPYPYFDINQ
jgi:hypothetical protein